MPTSRLPFVFARADRPFRLHSLPMLAGMAIAFAASSTLAAVGGWVVEATESRRYAVLALLINRPARGFIGQESEVNQEIVISAPVRSAIGSFAGSLKDVPASALGAHAIAATLRRSGLDPSLVDSVVMGNVIQAGNGMNVARRPSADAIVRSLAQRAPAAVGGHLQADLVCPPCRSSPAI